MQAINVHNYGGPEVLTLEELPRPTPGPDELLIKVYAVSVNPVDWKMRQGMMSHRLPFVPGWDVSGVVEEVGPGVKHFHPGDAVYASLDTSRDGAYAQYALVKESETARKPDSLDHLHAAAIPVAALTAWQALFDTAHLDAGQRILIHGAAGGVGSFAAQLAHWKGAHVIGTASGRNQAFLRKLGVDEPIDYETTRFEDVIRNVDVVLDLIGGETQQRSWKVLRQGGILVSTVQPPSADVAAGNGVRAGFTIRQPRSADLAQIAKLVDAGKLKVFIESVLPLSEVRHAHELSQSGHTRGKIVLRVN